MPELVRKSSGAGTKANQSSVSAAGEFASISARTVASAIGWKRMEVDAMTNALRNRA
jgi:hypothetical protein